MSDNNLFKNLDFINSKLSYKNDPKWIQFDTTLKILIYSLIQNIDTSIKLTNAQDYSIDESTTAGNIYNGIYITHPYSSNTNFTDEINDDEFNRFCIVFKNQLDKEPKLKIYSSAIQDPRLCVFEFLHFLFIPVRCDCSTLSSELKINSLRKFITVIMFLPFMNQYTNRYITAINNCEFMQKVNSTLLEGSQISEQMKTMKFDFISKSLQISYTVSNSMMIYLRVYTNIVILCSIEIMKLWCPNINECIRINPDFNGSWINPFDMIVNEQISNIQDFIKLTKTEKLKN